MMHLFLANGGPGGTNLDPLYDEALFWILAVLAVSAAARHDPRAGTRCTAR